MGGPGPKSQERAGGAKWGQVGPEGLGNGLEGLGRGPEVWRVPFGGAEWVLGKANAAQKRGGKKKTKKHYPNKFPPHNCPKINSKFQLEKRLPVKHQP